MSDTQDPLIALQRRVQQRQILAMMGINQWVQPSSETTNIADVTAPTTHTTTQSATSHTSVEQHSIRQLGINDLNADIPATDMPAIGLPNVEALDTTVLDAGILNNESVDAVSDHVDDDIDNYYDDASDTMSVPSHEQSPVTYSFDTSTPNVATASFIDTPIQQAEQTEASEPRHDTLRKVAPFDLQGGRYGNWVILVDIKALNSDGQKLWDNITQALSITCETTSFPICEGMDTAELANASLAGYVFKIGRSEEIQVAALTALPDGLEHPNLATVPTLDEMLADNSLKRQLWERLSD